jgi:hypothetical protein
LLTLAEVLKVAADRGRRLDLVMLHGQPFLSDGVSRPYPCPVAHLRGSVPKEFIYSFCRHFGLPPIDFSLDPDPDD